MNLSSFQAILFDFNGLIVDDEPIHFELFRQVLADEEITLTEKGYWEDYLGFDDKGLLHAVFERDKRHLTPGKLKKLIQKKNELYFPALRTGLKFFPDVLDFIREAKKRLPLAVVSGALRSEIEFVLEQGKISDCFEFIVSADDTKRGKPDPEGFLIAFAKLKKNHPHLLPEHCLVLEDSLAGIEAAHRARMKVAAFTHTYQRQDLHEADAIYDRFEELKSVLL